MINTKRTCATTRALFSLCTTCYLMAWLAKVSCSETEPQGNRTAKSTLEFDRICSMLRTIHYAKASSFRNTRAANKIFFFESSLLLLVSAFSHAAEVWLITCKACVEWHPCESILLQVIVIIIIRVTKPRIFVKPLHLSSLNCFLRYLLLHLSRFL
jgi:hypothetical protein